MLTLEGRLCVFFFCLLSVDARGGGMGDPTVSELLAGESTSSGWWLMEACRGGVVLWYPRSIWDGTYVTILPRAGPGVCCHIPPGFGVPPRRFAEGAGETGGPCTPDFGAILGGMIFLCRLGRVREYWIVLLSFNSWLCLRDPGGPGV